MQRSFTLDDEKDGGNEVNLTPMLDVVFILLIFFVVTASFIKEAGIDVDKPSTQEPTSQEAANILIVISKNNEIWIDNRIVDARTLRANIQRLHAENPSSGIVIQADKRSYNNSLVQVMDAARQAGIYAISIATNMP